MGNTVNDDIVKAVNTGKFYLYYISKCSPFLLVFLFLWGLMLNYMN